MPSQARTVSAAAGKIGTPHRHSCLASQRTTLTMPLLLTALHVVGTMINLMRWWLDNNHMPYTLAEMDGRSQKLVEGKTHAEGLGETRTVGKP